LLHDSGSTSRGSWRPYDRTVDDDLWSAVGDPTRLVHVTPAGRERRYRVDEAQLARAVAQLFSVGAAWAARLRRIKRIAEAIQHSKDQHGTQQ
jgi:hypothetical protein